MGMFDEVRVHCPKCGKDYNLQSKAGDCILREYELHNAPPEILADIAKEKILCEECNTLFVINVTTIAKSVILR